jgi:maltose-binding protein MalE
MATKLTGVLAIVLGVAAAACDGAASQSKSPEAKAAGKTNQAQPKLRDACEVLTAADVQPYVTEQLVAKPGRKGNNQTTCEYWGSDFVAGFSVVWEDGKSEFEMYNSATDLAAKMMAEPGVNVDSVVKPGPVAGLGDAATYSDLMPSFVLVGDQLLQFQVMLVPNARAAFVPLAKKAIGRLEQDEGAA